MRDGKNGYAPSPGIPQAIEAIRDEAMRKGIMTVRDVFVTSGVSETVDLCLSALVNPGEDILTPSPDYPLYSAVLCKLGIALNAYDLNEEDAWQPELADIERKLTPGTRGIVLINPNNPTGSLCSRRMLEQIAEIARRHNLVVFSDEIYDKLVFDYERVIMKGRIMKSGMARGMSRLPRLRPMCLASLSADVEELSGSGMAHWLGHCFRRCCGGEALYGRHSPAAAGAVVRQSSGAICHQGGAGGSAGSSG